jgi:hypothetical protein
MNRALTAARLQLIHPLVILGMPWLIAASSFAINWVIWRIAGIGAEPDAFTGGILALYITEMIVMVQAVTQMLPFAMGLSLSRRIYWLGTAVFAVVVSLGSGVALTVLGLIEDTTGGWWAGLEFWVPPPLQADNVALQLVASAAPMLAFCFLGIGLGVVYKRWGNSGVWGLALVTVLALGGLAVLMTWQKWWLPVGSWLDDQSFVTLAVGLPVALALIAAALSFTGIRRVVP